MRFLRVVMAPLGISSSVPKPLPLFIKLLYAFVIIDDLFLSFKNFNNFRLVKQFALLFICPNPALPQSKVEVWAPDDLDVSQTY